MITLDDSLITFELIPSTLEELEFCVNGIKLINEMQNTRQSTAPFYKQFILADKYIFNGCWLSSYNIANNSYIFCYDYYLERLIEHIIQGTYDKEADGYLLDIMKYYTLDELKFIFNKFSKHDCYQLRLSRLKQLYFEL